MITEIEPAANTFTNLSLLAYQAGQTRKGDLAATKAVELTEDKDDKKELKEQLEQAKSQAALQQIQDSRPRGDAHSRHPPANPLRAAIMGGRALVAQLAEQRTLNPKVEGSIPSGGTHETALRRGFVV